MQKARFLIKEKQARNILIEGKDEESESESVSESWSEIDEESETPP